MPKSEFSQSDITHVIDTTKEDLSSLKNELEGINISSYAVHIYLGK